MPDLILLKPASQIGTGLSPGEHALDEAGRTLHIDLPGGIVAVPLDVAPLRPAEDEEEGVALYTADGPDYGVLEGGGGGLPVTDLTWSAPGVTPVTFESVAVAADGTITARLVISEPVSLVALGVAPLTTGVEFDFGLVGVIDFTATAFQTGIFEAEYEADLAPGRYMVYVTPTAPMSFSMMSGLAPWASALQQVPVFLSFA